MSKLRLGVRSRVPARFCSRGPVVLVPFAAVCLLLSACASRPATHHQAGYWRPHAQAVPSEYHREHARVEMEDDGLPVQAAPVRRRKPEPDDPSEPFSPNYGEAPRVKQAQAAMPGHGEAGARAYEDRYYDRRSGYRYR